MSSATTTREVAGRALETSNLDKVFFPDDGVTKGDVLDHYERVADVMLPHVGGRPLVLQRFPDGVERQGFFQKNTPSHTPDWIGRVELATTDGGSTTHSVVEDAAGPVYLANQGTVVFHTLLSAAVAPDRPVEVVVDLDPAAAPYSLRPLPGAPVAVPLDWDEALASSFHPQRITISNLARRLAQKDDPWTGLDPPSTTIADALGALPED